jgi:ribonuclease BN (tRNA processing enzyme)
LISAGNSNVLVDMGNGTQANLNKLGVNPRNLSALLFTHHHLDHNEEFVPLFIRLLLGRDRYGIIGPPGTIQLAESNLRLYEEDISYRLGKTKRSLSDRKKALVLREVKGGESFAIGKIRASTLKVPHTIYTTAYRFDYEGRSIVVTGDLTYSENLPAFAQNADFMIIDSGGMIMNNGMRKSRDNKASGNKRGSRTRAHVNLDESSSMAEKGRVKNLVYTHFTAGDVDSEASLKQIRENYHGNVIFGQDLMIVGDHGNEKALYQIVDTAQTKFYSSTNEMKRPVPGDDYFGQDASYIGNKPSYTDNRNGTITDNVTGLIWQKAMKQKMTVVEARAYAKALKLGGFSDWRVPSIKELYSLIQFTGSVKGQRAIDPFIDTTYFDQPLGDASRGERQIDAQTWSSTEYVGKTMRNDDTVFGVNFVDGRIKGYPKYKPRTRQPNKMYFRLVRGNLSYGKNDFVKKSSEIIADKATGLMWQKSDSLALGKMHGRIMDVHGAGAQRSDPKFGQPMSRGPQGDMIRVKNFVRCVRGGAVTLASVGNRNTSKPAVREGGKQNSIQQKFMKRHDSDGDGRISKSEFTGPSRRFSHFDKNNDGYVTEDEAPSTKPKER